MLDQTLVALGFAEYTAQKGGTLNMMMYTLSLMMGTAGLPHVIIRFFTVPKVSDARSSAGWALFFIAILYTTAPAVGSMARLNLTNTIQMGEVGSVDGNLEYAARPDWFKNWENTGLLAFEDKMAMVESNITTTRTQSLPLKLNLMAGKVTKW
jgi:cation/acetate symporter